mmetsp:Transcript_23110/g.63806  ORF Transcript_23110/g.63806 Transcript_23110/m.63806 type:complete len:217 (+) Transcript_23110:1120-1770(+)
MGSRLRCSQGLCLWGREWGGLLLGSSGGRRGTACFLLQLLRLHLLEGRLQRPTWSRPRLLLLLLLLLLLFLPLLLFLLLLAFALLSFDLCLRSFLAARPARISSPTATSACALFAAPASAGGGGGGRGHRRSLVSHLFLDLLFHDRLRRVPCPCLALSSHSSNSFILLCMVLRHSPGHPACTAQLLQLGQHSRLFVAVRGSADAPLQKCARCPIHV